MLLLMFTFTPSVKHHIAGRVTMTMAVTHQRVSSHTIGLGALFSFLLYISSLSLISQTFIPITYLAIFHSN